MSQAQVCERNKRLESSGKPDAWKLARPVWGWGRGVIPRPTPPFERVFGKCQWAVLFVVAQDNKTYAKLSFNVGPGGQVLIPVGIDYRQDFEASNQELWDTEYKANVNATEWMSSRTRKQEKSTNHDLTGYALPYDFIEEFEKMELEERQFILDELADKPELWNEEEVIIL